jgi:hypothetical protein
MSEERRYFVYIMANASKRIYTGMTNSLRRRVREHKLKLTQALRLNTISPASSTSRASRTYATRLSARSRSRLGLARSGLRWLIRSIPNGTICRESGISRRRSVSRLRSRDTSETRVRCKQQPRSLASLGMTIPLERPFPNCHLHSRRIESSIQPRLFL